MFSLKEWLSKTPEEMFGFGDKDGLNQPMDDINDLNDEPLKRLSVGLMLDELVRLGGTETKQPAKTWNGLVEYGSSQSGAIAVDITPLGSVRAIIRRSIHDIYGENVWICKKVLPIAKMYHDPGGGKEIQLAHNLHEAVNQVDQATLDAPRMLYPEFEKVVMATADAIRRDHPQIFIFEGVKKLDHNNYLTFLAYRGHGVEAPSQTRCEQFHINMQFNKRGLIRCWGNEITSPTRQHKWQSGIPEWDEWFAPTQHPNEIMDAIVKSLSVY